MRSSHIESLVPTTYSVIFVKWMNDYVGGHYVAPDTGWFGRKQEKDPVSQAGGWRRHWDLPTKHPRWRSVLRARRKPGGKDKGTEKAGISWPLTSWHAARFTVFRNRWKIPQNELIFLFQNKSRVQSKWIKFKAAVRISLYLTWICLWEKKKSLTYLKRGHIVKD